VSEAADFESGTRHSAGSGESDLSSRVAPCSPASGLPPLPGEVPAVSLPLRPPCLPKNPHAFLSTTTANCTTSTPVLYCLTNSHRRTTMQSSLTSPVMSHHPHHPHHPQHAQAALAHHSHPHPHPILQPFQQGQPSVSPDPSHQQGPYIDTGMPGPSMNANTVRKKGGRGPGKRENRDKPVVSVRSVFGALFITPPTGRLYELIIV
jgi:hypothetical protein